MIFYYFLRIYKILYRNCIFRKKKKLKTKQTSAKRTGPLGYLATSGTRPNFRPKAKTGEGARSDRWDPEARESGTGEEVRPALARRRWLLRRDQACPRAQHPELHLGMPFSQPLPHQSAVANGDGGQRR
jgi:hypothetical protein